MIVLATIIINDKTEAREEFCNINTFYFTENNFNNKKAVYDKLGSTMCCYDGKDNIRNYRCMSIRNMVYELYPDIQEQIFNNLSV